MAVHLRRLAGRATALGVGSFRGRAAGSLNSWLHTTQTSRALTRGGLGLVPGRSADWLPPLLWCGTTRAFSTHPPEVSAETRGVHGLVHALNSLDAAARVQFFERFERYKGLKRVASVSRQRFLLDCEKIFRVVEDDEETAIPLLHLLACMDSVGADELEEHLEGFFEGDQGTESDRTDMRGYPVEHYSSAENAIEVYELKRKAKPVHENDGYLEDDESSDDERLMTFPFTSAGPVDGDGDGVAAAMGGEGGGEDEERSSGSEEHDSGVGLTLAEAKGKKDTPQYAKLSSVPPDFFENADLAVKCAGCGERFTYVRRLFLVKAGLPIHIMSVDPGILAHVHLLKIRTGGAPEYQCRCNSCRSNIGHMIRTFDGVSTRQRIAFASRALVAEDLSTGLHGSLAKWKAHIVSQSIGRKIRKEVYSPNGLMSPYTINEADEEASSARNPSARGKNLHYELVCSETGEVVDPCSNEIRSVRPVGVRSSRTKHRVFIPGKAIRLSAM